jgi:autoinducer 2 (AI-2) kinase
MQPLMMAIDAGTGSCRCLLFNLRGEEVAAASAEWTHPIASSAPGGFDFDTRENGRLLDKVIAGCLKRYGGSPRDVKAISTTSMREGVVLYDKVGDVLWACPNIDARATAEAEALVEAGLADLIFDTAGDWVSITTPARLKWLEAHRPDILQRTVRFGLISDWAATRLTGEYFTEPSAGSSTALFDLSSRSWSSVLFDRLGIDVAIAPTVVESGTPIGAVTAVAAERTGLAPGTPVVAGGGDTQLGLIGLNRRRHDATLFGGSFWQMTTLLDHPLTDPGRRPRTLCHAAPGLWMMEGIGFLSGLSMRWFRDAFWQAEAGVAATRELSGFSVMEAAAGSMPPGANGVTAVMGSVMQSDGWVQPSPTLLGFDFNRPERTGRAAATRAIMEAAAYAASEHLGLLEQLSSVNFTEIVFSSGASQGTLWPQIVADVIGRPVVIPTVSESTSLGCAMLAAVGAAFFSSLDEASVMAAGPKRTVEPNLAHKEVYDELSKKWLGLNDAMIGLAEAGLVTPMWRPAGARPKRSAGLKYRY